ncbi:MAG: redox-sensitive bicupin YhaK (pirin superfamily) [Paraglaciecola sp.]|jgi:redox-sensitive bicupin YhaK (pirin superfamily)
MERRKFIKGSAILGATVASPIFIKEMSGMFENKTARKVHRILNADRTQVGTLPILRAFAGNHRDYVSPYVLFDEFGPVDVAPNDNPLRVDAHPHAGVIPTTYFINGSGHHKDSLDYDFQIGKGEFMIFSSGKGAIHMEETGQQLYEEGGQYHGFQIWLNMPAAHKFIDPTTAVYREKDMDLLETEDYSIKVIMGNLFNAQSTVNMLSPAFYFHVKMKPDARLDIPTNPQHNAFIYNIGGDLELEGQKPLKKNQVALYERGDSLINLYAKDGAEFLLLGGQPLDEPVYSYGPFVMNNEAQIRECIANYQNGKMGNPDLVN